jgi:bifunctional DNA primase/polymerase-like protein
MIVSGNKVQSALQYASLGIPIFPIDPGSKRPFANEQLSRVAALPHPERKRSDGRIYAGFHQATTDVAIIEAWWKHFPDANIGMPTGPESGIWVLDIDHDPENGKDGSASLAELEREHGSLPQSVRTRTPSGGMHILFKYDGELVRSRAGDIAPGIDTKGVKENGTASGYILLPPSSRADGGCYAFVDGEFDLKGLELAPRWLVYLATYNHRQRENIALDDVEGLEPEFWPKKAQQKSNSVATASRPSSEGPESPVRTFDSSSSLFAYLEAALLSELKILRNAPAGARQEALFKSTSSIASLAKARMPFVWHSDAALQQMLFDTSTQSGAQDADHERWQTIQYHWDRAQPRRLDITPTQEIVAEEDVEAPVRIPIAEVEDVLSKAARDFMNGPVMEAFDRKQVIRGNVDDQTDLPVPDLPNAIGWKVEPGAGKTRITLTVFAASDYNVVVAQPHHDLTRQSVDELGSDAEILRGYDQPDPSDPTQQTKMCPKERERAALSSAGLGIYQNACLRKIWKPGKNGGVFCESEIRCKLNPAPKGSFGETAVYDSPQCGMAKQRTTYTGRWIATHASLFYPRPDNVREPTILCIDEDILQAAVDTKGQSLPLDTLQNPPPPKFYFEDRDGLVNFGDIPERVKRVFDVLGKAVRDSFDGDISANESVGLKRDWLAFLGTEPIEAAIDYCEGQQGIIQQWFNPKLSPAEFERRAENAKVNLEFETRILILRELLRIKQHGGVGRSGRLRISSSNGHLQLTVYTLREIHPSWTANAAILVMDATLADPDLLEGVLGRPLDVTLDLAVEWPDEVKVRQITAAPVSANKLGFRAGEAGDQGKRNRYSIRRLIERYSHDRGYVLLITRKDLGKWLKDTQLPDNVIWVGFGKVTGLNEFTECNETPVPWQDIDEIIIVGALDPGLVALEHKADVIKGIEVEQQPADERGRRMLAYRDKPVTLPTGDRVVLKEIDHPSSTVVQLAELQLIGGLIQAIGRGRPIRRDGKPLQITLLGDLYLPIPLDEVVSFHALETGRIIGVLLGNRYSTNPADLQNLHPGLFETVPAAAALIRELRSKSVSENCETPISYINRVLTEWRYSSVQYRTRGSNAKPSWFVYLEQSIDDPISYLSEHFGRAVELYANPIEKMAESGIILTSTRNAATAYDELFANVSAAQRATKAFNPHEQTAHPIRYQMKGPGQTEQVAWVTGTTNIEASGEWLESHIDKPVALVREDWPLTAGELIADTSYSLDEIATYSDHLGADPELGNEIRKLQSVTAPLIHRMANIERLHTKLRDNALSGCGPDSLRSIYLWGAADAPWRGYSCSLSAKVSSLLIWSICRWHSLLW